MLIEIFFFVSRIKSRMFSALNFVFIKNSQFNRETFAGDCKSLIDTGLNHLKVALAEALESFEGFLAVVGDGVVDALLDVGADVIRASLP